MSLSKELRVSGFILISVLGGCALEGTTASSSETTKADSAAASADRSAARATAVCGGGLFTEVAAPETKDLADDPTVVRSRFVLFNLGLLTEASSSQKPLSLNLFDDVCLRAVVESLERPGPDSLIWTGRISGVDEGEAVLVVQDGVMAGSITLPEAFYQVRYVGDGIHAVQQMDQAAFPPEAPITTPEGAGRKPQPE